MSPANPGSTVPRFHCKKVSGVVIAFVITVALGILAAFLMPGSAKDLLVAGLTVAAVSQLAESIGKSSDVQEKPTWIDGFELYGEGIKFLGTLLALLGAVFALDSP